LTHYYSPSPSSTTNESSLLIFILQKNNSNALAFRPSTKHASISGCYFVGASTHPGTGVPVCLAGAKITTEEILEDYGITIPWGKALPADYQARKSGGKLDAIKYLSTTGMMPLELWVWTMIVAFLAVILSSLMVR